MLLRTPDNIIGTYVATPNTQYPQVLDFIGHMWVFVVSRRNSYTIISVKTEVLKGYSL